MISVILSALAQVPEREDEKDLTKVSCDLHLYEVYVKGFIEGCGGALTETELDMLPTGSNPL